MKQSIQVVLFVILFTFPTSLWAVSEEQAALDAIQKQYEKVKSFKAKFAQRSYVKMMNQTQEASGEVLIKKPGKMRWVYNAPDPQVLVANEKMLWLYVPEDEQVTKMPMDNVYSSNTPAMFLSGKGRLTESFNVSRVTREEKQTIVVLIPKQKDHGLDRLILYADNKNYQITGSSVYDKLGNKTDIKFSNIQVNVDIPAGTFQFQIPKGVEVLDYTAAP